ncbi:NAD(P)-dependent oxidoreductase [Niveispirillum sp.]|uniref:NAD(P)-dependent oxidoreductase n=1 Tax=Niveispirillum sp. TaxID=1917217 RepID=UPI001B65EF02|nr:NAD(P)-dependent oxidoreductase [Niveispirillum sp.]MBP7336550.1 NAD(P)-dependent oxidoreductase [Niveispirillum sp.]
MTRSIIGFIGLGVMGEPMCRHLADKSGAAVLGFDLSDEPLARLAAHGVERAASVADLFARADIILVSLPSGRHLEGLCDGPDGALAQSRAGQIFIDLGTSPLDLTRRLAADFAARGVRYADAPVARTRAAAEAGTLALTVGGPADLFAAIEPLLRCFASEVTHCGPVGAGQIVKILNNMVVVGTVVALSEAASIAKAAGIETKALFETFAKASADSFALRNHGLKSVAAGEFPERVFSTDYMLKDMGYALRMAADGGIEARGADYGRELLERASAAGHGGAYWPVISTLLRPDGSDPA